MSRQGHSDFPDYTNSFCRVPTAFASTRFALKIFQECHTQHAVTYTASALLGKAHLTPLIRTYRRYRFTT